MDIVEHNRQAWNAQARGGCRWSRPVGDREIESARAGRWRVVLTPNRSVPAEWFDEVAGKEVLCLASGGGQQAPVLAAAGARVTSFDLADEQLAKDAALARRHSLALETIRGDMADLSVFAADRFDLVFHPVANVFVEELAPVWQECHRVLRRGGRLLAGFMNPAFYLFDQDEIEETGRIEVKYSLPYADIKDLDETKLGKLRREGAPLEFGHTLEQQIGGQIAAGFIIAGLYEDDWDDEATLVNRFTTTSIATLALKLE